MKNKDILRNKIKEIIKESAGQSLATTRVVKLIDSLPFKKSVNAAGGEIYAVGGIVRDAIMQKASDDLDIVIRGIEFEKLMSILEHFGKATDTTKYEDGETGKRGAVKFKPADKVYRKYLDDNGVEEVIDIMLPKKEFNDPNTKGHKGLISDVNPNYTIEDDMERRDITINAIAISQYGEIIDKDGQGQKDIKNGVIRAVSPSAFVEDPIRMIRSARFSARYDYNIAPETIKAIKQHAAKLADKKELPKERFLMEFEKMIGKTDLGRAVKLLVDLGMFLPIFGTNYSGIPYNEFNKVKYVFEMGYLMLKDKSNAASLYLQNIDNSKEGNKGIAALIDYDNEVRNRNLDSATFAKKLSRIYKKSKLAFQSAFMEDDAKIIGDKFTTGELPVDPSDINFNGNLAIPYVKEYAEEKEIKITNAWMGPQIGKIKKAAVDAVYSGDIKNETSEIENFIKDNIKKIMES